MISKLKVVVIVTGLFWGPLICVSHAQQAQTESQAVQLIGLAGLEQNTKGRLTVLNGTLRFIHAKGTAAVSVESIEDVVTGKDSNRVIGGTFGKLASLAAPFGSGRALPLLRKKVDTLTIQYRDPSGGLHGAIFTMPAGNAQKIKRELIAQGAHTRIPMEPDSNKTTSAPKGHRQ
jgi:hypothetical protein